jgi:predicted nucleic acid-binding protein
VTEIAVTDFGLFSLCIHIEKHHQESLGFAFIQDLLQSGVRIIPTEPLKAIQVLFEKTLTTFDYDDFVQYRAAKENKLILVSLDQDFFKKKLDIPVLRPSQVR